MNLYRYDIICYIFLNRFLTDKLMEKAEETLTSPT